MNKLEAALLKITGAFEGSGYDNVTNNFDGQGLSAGVLQWCYGQESLQKRILRPYLEKHGSIDALDIFPKKTIDLSATMNGRVAIGLAKNVMHNGSKLKPEWTSAWKKFLTLPETIEIQIEASKIVEENTLGMCSIWDLKTCVAYFWFFDMFTQNGSLEKTTKQKPDRAYAKLLIQYADSSCQKEWNKIDFNALSDEQIILFIASYHRSLTALKKYAKDVFARKGTIALGVGIVHGDKYDFRDIYKNFDLK
jgi:hypothetical protein